MTILNSEVTGLSQALATNYPNDAGFVECLEDTFEFLESLPSQYSFAYHPQFTPDKMGADKEERSLNVLRNLRGWLGFLVYTTSYKVRDLVLEIADGLNTHKYLRVTMAARSVIEHTATLNYYFEKLWVNFNELRTLWREGRTQEGDQLTFDIINLLLQYAQSTRLNWAAYMREDYDEFYESFEEVEERVRQRNIMTLVDKLPQVERGMRFFYCLLSDYVHPNIASHTLTIDRTERLSDGRMEVLLSSRADSKASLVYALHAISHPMNATLSLLRDQLQALRAELHQWETLLA